MKEKTPVVLVIDDEQGIRDMLSYVLSKEGYKVFTAENGKVGIEKVMQEDIDIVISDIKMPGIDGVSVLGKIKEIKPEIEVIMATGYASLETAIESLRKGAFDYIHKPFNIDELTTIIAKAYETKQLKSQLVSLQELDKLKDAFLSAISHDLKTPIMVISNALELLLGKAWTEEDEVKIRYKYNENTKKLLEIIDRQTQKMRILVTDLLDFARMEAGFFVLKKKVLKPAKIIYNVVDSMRSLAENKKIQIVVKQLPEEVEIECDEEQIERVISNLLSNSIKYTQEGGIINLWFEELPNEIKFVVEDNGIGIEKEHLERVFERFYRIKHSENERQDGTGLGLSICKKIIELHNGKIWAESEGLNKGSKFIFVLPR